MSDVEVYATRLKIPTYKILRDDLNPMFDSKLNIYPYTLQNFRSKTRDYTDYEAVIIENEYLRLIILPELGGRLYSALDKRNNKEIFYRNKVIKPRMIGTRGAWFSGGVEFNFPVSHSPNTMDRVNFHLKNYENGSASIVFGNIEQMSQMNWKVELRLYPGKAYIQERIQLYNPTPQESRFYFWTNAAVAFNKSVELIYPFDWCTNNIESRYVKWPYFQGANYSNLREATFSYEAFGKLLTHNSFGIYNHDDNYGVVHYADRKAIKGAKFFTWGNDDRAVAWNRALTDDQSQYLEIQSGPFESQMVYKFMMPYQKLAWNEYWYGIFDMKGFKYAQKELAINYRYLKGCIEFTIIAQEDFKACDILLRVHDNKFCIVKDLSPKHVEIVPFFIDEVFLKKDGFRLDIYCSGNHLACMDGRDEDTVEYPDHDLYEDTRATLDNQGNMSLFKEAVLKESLGLNQEAITLYKKNLEENPQCVLTLNKLGKMYFKQLAIEEAGNCFKKVLRYDNRNSEARFYLALVEKEQGNEKRAKRLLMDITAEGAYFGASIVELIRLNISMGLFKEAATLISSGWGNSPPLAAHFVRNPKLPCCLRRGVSFETNSGYNYGYILFLISLCFRKENLIAKAKAAIDFNPISDEYVLAEKYLLSDGLESEEVLSYTHGDERVLLPLALEYYNLHQYEDAVKITQLIKEPTMKSGFLQLQLNYILGLAHEVTLAGVLQGSLDYVFINEKELCEILGKYRENDTSGKTDYLLGTYYYSIGRMEDALIFYRKSYEKGLRYTVLLRNIGYILYHCKNDPENALPYFEEDLVLNNGINASSLRYADKIYKEKGKLDKREKLISYMKNTTNKSLILQSYVELLCDLGKDEEALKVLEGEEFENWEGVETSGPCYRNVIIRLALKEVAKGDIQNACSYIYRVDTYPPNLNYGDSVITPLAEMYYFKGLINNLAGEHEAAVEQFRLGLMELDSPCVTHTNKSKEYAMKCLEEFKKF
jgi:tetratricopeptide (TPR) repeat protein